MAGNSKDVVIRFTGQNLVGPVINGLQKQLNDFATNARRASMVTLKGTVGDALDVQAERARKKRFESLKAEQVVMRARQKEALATEAAGHRSRFEMIRASEERALRLRQFYARKEAAIEQARAARFAGFRGIGKKALGAAGLAAGSLGELAGDSTTGRVAGAIGNIAGGAALGSLVGGVPGAVFFATVEALKEFTSASKQAAESAAAFAQSLRASSRDAIQKQRDRFEKLGEPFKQGFEALVPKDAFGDRILPGPQFTNPFAQKQQAFFDTRIAGEKEAAERAKTIKDLRDNRDERAREATKRIIREQQTELGRPVTDEERAKATRRGAVEISEKIAELEREADPHGREQVELRRAESRFNKDGRLGGRIGRAFRGAGGALSRGIEGGIVGLRERLRDPLKASGEFLANTQRRLELQRETESPAESIRRQMAALAAERDSGRITPALYQRAQRDLRLSAISQLPAAQQTPGLAATEGRFLTMGRRSPEVDELSALRREAKLNSEKQTKELVAAIREGGGAVGSL